MKKFLCALAAFVIVLGCCPVFAAPATDTDIPVISYPSTDTDIPDNSPPEGILIAPAPTPSTSDEKQGWDALIEDFLAEHDIDPDTVTLGYYNTVTGEEHYFRGDEMMTAASVKKVPLNMYYAEKVANGDITWETTYGSLPYSEAQELSLRYSNNEYTDILINAIGTYPEYRRAMCPYIGVDPDEQEFGFFTVNELSARQAIYCLKLLQSDPERYPGVYDNMLLASPGEYFEQYTEEYEIAQKYGWYVVDNHNCINCVGIVELDEPILLAIFTDNCRMGKNILGEYCALMCEYTEEGIALRAAEEAERIAAEEAEAQRLAEEEARRKAEEEAAKAQQEEEERLQAEKEKEEDKNADPAIGDPGEEDKMIEAENALRLVACIIACAVLAIALGIVGRRKAKHSDDSKGCSVFGNIISVILGLAAIAAIVLTVSTCIKALDAKPVIMDESSEPAAVAEEFVSKVLGGDASGAEALLLGSGKLGLDSEPEDNLGKMLYAALQDSFSYEVSGQCVQESIDASQSFTITYLDIPSLTALQQDATNARLAKYLEEADRAEEVQAEDGSWLPEVAMRALEEVTAELLENAEEHYVRSELTLQLQYTAGDWKVIANEELFAILSGNTAY